MLLSSYTSKKIEAGCDEAGRGCLAGPVAAAAVILPKDYENILLDDSKKLSAMAREKLRPVIEEEALAWAVAFVDNNEIDEINILNASFLAMNRAVDKLTQVPELLLIDGNRFNQHPDIEHECFIKGDGRFLSIAAASILAKVARDTLLESYARSVRGYGLGRNMGYGTAEHRRALAHYGPSEFHRRSFHVKGKLPFTEADV